MYDHVNEFDNAESALESEQDLFDRGDDSFSRYNEIADGLRSLFGDAADPNELPDDKESDGDTEIDRNSLFIRDSSEVDYSEITDSLRNLFPEKEDQSIPTQRGQAVRQAWKNEKELVLEGKGTRDWTAAQQKELIEEEKISGFEGQHMRNVAKHPEYAGNPENIQFLPYLEHLYGAHQGNFRNDTEGYYDSETGEIKPVDDSFSVPVIDLSDKYDPGQAEYLSKLGREFGYGRKEDYDVSKERHKSERSGYNFWEGKPDINKDDDSNKT